MKINGEKVVGTFVERLNRFEALVEVDGIINLVHVPNTGRLSELLIKGASVILLRATNPNRKTKYSMIFVKKGAHIICINSILANSLFEEGFREGLFELKGKLRREINYGDSRLDFFIDSSEPTFIEVKCCTFEEDNIAKFPDAPTTRGQKHLKELMRAVHEGFHSMVFIFVFIDYVTEFTPNYIIDPIFSELLFKAYKNGVEVKVYNCSITADEIKIYKNLKIYF